MSNRTSVGAHPLFERSCSMPTPLAFSRPLNFSNESVAFRQSALGNARGTCESLACTGRCSAQPTEKHTREREDAYIKSGLSLFETNVLNYTALSGSNFRLSSSSFLLCREYPPTCAPRCAPIRAGPPFVGCVSTGCLMIARCPVLIPLGVGASRDRGERGVQRGL